MEGPRGTGFGVRAGRLLALVTVLFGLVSMHGLASSHHAPAFAVGHAAAAATAAAQPDDAAEAEPHPHARDAVSSPQQPTGPLATPAGPACDDDCEALGALCVAVLAAAVVLAVAVAVVRHRRRTVAAPPRGAVAARGERVVPAPAGARIALPPPDPVRELCISRT